MRTDPGRGSVLVQPPGEGDPAGVISLAAGQSITFGRGAPGVPVGVRLADPGVSRVAGEITAAAGHWELTNLSPVATYVVENPEGGGEHIRVQPLRLCAPVPFELSRVLVPAGTGTVAFQVFAPEPPFLDRTCLGGAASGDRTLRAFPLDETAKYFLVLVAMSEPRLRGVSIGIPTAERVAARLRPIPGYRDLTARAVDFHVDYLARTKLRLRRRGHEDDGTPQGFAERREALVTFALRFGLVTEDHLGLLPPRGRC
ncbi:MAG: serine/threonine protein kinase [Actinomycetales bacterium]|nr:serine/threonine protein kinase [Actinomycetales bacterium]